MTFIALDNSVGKNYYCIIFVWPDLFSGGRHSAVVWQAVTSLAYVRPVLTVELREVGW